MELDSHAIENDDWMKQYILFHSQYERKNLNFSNGVIFKAQNWVKSTLIEMI